MGATEQLVTRVDFVGVPSTDLERTVAFYEGTLGLRRSALVLERGFAEFETDNLTLSAYVPTMMGREHRPNPNPIALHVADMDAARAKLQAEGVTFSGDTFDTGVCFMSFFEDPDGNALMLHHRYAPRNPDN
jgi:predicted enzyme related to lactoylglutathione lyase